MVRVPASANPAVSANIPRVPEMLRVLANMSMLPPPCVLVDSAVTVALIWAFCPISMVLALISIWPGAPTALVSVVRLVFWSRFRFPASMLMLPAFPVPWVSAWSRLLLVSRISWGVWRVISPALP